MAVRSTSGVGSTDASLPTGAARLETQIAGLRADVKRSMESARGGGHSVLHAVNELVRTKTDEIRALEAELRGFLTPDQHVEQVKSEIARVEQRSSELLHSAVGPNSAATLKAINELVQSNRVYLRALQHELRSLQPADEHADAVRHELEHLEAQTAQLLSRGTISPGLLPIIERNQSEIRELQLELRQLEPPPVVADVVDAQKARVPTASQLYVSTSREQQHSLAFGARQLGAADRVFGGGTVTEQALPTRSATELRDAAYGEIVRLMQSGVKGSSAMLRVAAKLKGSDSPIAQSLFVELSRKAISQSWVEFEQVMAMLRAWADSLHG